MLSALFYLSGKRGVIMSGVQPKRLELSIKLDPSQVPSTMLARYLKKWMMDNQVETATIYIEEDIDWDVSPMRKFFHGIIIPAFVVKYNETQDRDSHRLFNREFVKRFLKAKFLGWVKNDLYRTFEKEYRLASRPSNIADFAQIMKIGNYLTDQFEINHTADLSPERYWKLINDCESYYFAEFHDMFDIRNKPQSPINQEDL